MPRNYYSSGQKVPSKPLKKLHFQYYENDLFVIYDLLNVVLLQAYVSYVIYDSYLILRSIRLKRQTESNNK